MDFKFIKNISEESADIYINGEIGCDLNGNILAGEINYLNTIGVKEIVEHINSPGGNIIEGQSVIAANINSKAKVITINEGVAASMGAMILFSGHEVKAFDFSQTMIHEPNRFGETIDTTKNEETKKALISLRNMLRDMLVSRSGKSEKEIEKMLKATTWMNAEEAMESKFIDSIITTSKKPNIKNGMSQNEIISCIAAFYKPETNIKTNKMKQICNFLEINEASTEGVILNKIKEDRQLLAEAISMNDDIQAKLTEANNKAAEKEIEIATLKAENDKFKAEQEAITNKLVADAVEKAHKDGKITKESIPMWTEDAKNDLEGFNKKMASIKIAHANINNMLDGKGEKVTDFDDLKEKGSFEKIHQQDSERLKELYTNNLELFKSLVARDYGKYVEEDWTYLK